MMCATIRTHIMKSEFALIESIAKNLGGRRGHGVVVGVGDDAAVLRPSAHGDLVVTVDSQVENRHFKRAWMSWHDLGWRLAAVNLSDVAAMGASPRFAVVSLAVPRSVRGTAVAEIMRGANRHLGRYGAVVVGGNLSATSGPLVCDLTLIGSCRRGGAWRRRARAGDAIVVAGTLGSAAAGVALLRSRGRVPRSGPLVRAFVSPTPGIPVAEALRRTTSVHGAIDVSDGLSSDLIHMCEAGRAGCDVRADALPVAPAVLAFCRQRRLDPVRWALNGGEDYALVLSVAPKRAPDVCRKIRGAGFAASVIGRFTRRRGEYRLIDASNRATAIAPGGWDHFGRQRWT
jgi:thiamine-monophosphate kinase